MISSLHCLTLDRDGRSHLEQVQALLAGGADWVQYRTKRPMPLAERIAEAATLVDLAQRSKAQLIVNDSIEVALRSRADGLHIGKLDMDPVRARNILGPKKILGGTVNSLADAVRAVELGVFDYVGVGPWRFTPTKERLAPILSREEFAEILAVLGPLPAVLIGGIVLEDLPAVHALGAHGVAVTGAVSGAPEQVQAAVSSLQREWTRLHELGIERAGVAASQNEKSTDEVTP